MPERKFDAGSKYRYGFNGKENDNEVKGEGNQQDYGERIYDSRIGRWLSLDPLMKKYPGETPYLFVGANPIIYNDPDGQDRILKIYEKRDGKTTLVRIATHKGEYVWGKAHYNKNIHTKMNINQDVIIDYDKSEVTLKAAKIMGYQDGEGFSDIGKIYESVKDNLIEFNKERKGEGKSDRGGWTLTTSVGAGAGPDAGKVIQGKSSGTINVDYISVVTELVASPDDLEDALLSFGGAGISIANNNYLPEGLIPSTSSSTEAKNTSGKKIELLKETKKAEDSCTVCQVGKRDSSHVNETVRKVNEGRIKEVTEKQ